MEEIIKLAAQGGGVGLLVLFIGLTATGRLRWGAAVDAERARMEAAYQARIDAVVNDRDEWRSMTMSLTGQSVESVSLANTSHKALLHALEHGVVRQQS